MTLSVQLGLLEGAGLIRLAAIQPELEYRFRHVLVKDAAYHSLVKNDRRALHQVVGETLERLYANPAHHPARGDLYPLLAFHFAGALLAEAQAKAEAQHIQRLLWEVLAAPGDLAERQGAVTLGAQLRRQASAALEKLVGQLAAPVLRAGLRQRSAARALRSASASAPAGHPHP